MTLTELFNDPKTLLPRKYDEDIEECLEAMFAEYFELVEGLNTTASKAGQVHAALATIRIIAEGIRESVSLYLEGLTADSYREFEKVMSKSRPWINDLVFPLSRLMGRMNDQGDQTSLVGNLYRMRVGAMKQFSRRELFHIPFEDRCKVSSQRYSIPGLPSLYLGSCLWICWEELGRPDFGQIHASRFEGRVGLKVLDFGASPTLLGSGLGDLGDDGAERLEGNFAIGQAILWPLLAACSLTRRFPGTPFAPEYIIPQFLLQWVRKNKDVDGIRYFSTRIGGTSHTLHKALNFVFPVKTKRESGLCDELQSRFSLTQPLAWPVLQFWEPSIMPGILHDKSTIPLADGVIATYKDTDFFKTEEKLKTLVAVRP